MKFYKKNVIQIGLEMSAVKEIESWIMKQD